MRLGRQALLQCPCQARFADASLARDQNDAALASLGSYRRILVTA